MSTKTIQGSTPVWALIFAALSSGSAFAATIGGTATNANVVVASPGCAVVPAVNWTVLRVQPIPAAVWPRHCIATGSADAIRPTTVTGEFPYYFTVSNAVNPICDQGQERTLTFQNNGAIWDNSRKEITTTGGWMAGAANNPGYFTFPANVGGNIFFLARRGVNSPNMVVDDASLTVTCTTANELPLPSPPNPALVQ